IVDKTKCLNTSSINMDNLWQKVEEEAMNTEQPVTSLLSVLSPSVCIVTCDSASEFSQTNKHDEKYCF
ncbi:hypothetical protein STEG23_018769, partial [Scotinomys teguina]